MAEARQRTAEERQARREQMQALRPVMEEMRAANRAAGDRIHELLTDEQEAALVSLMHADRPRRGGR